MLGLLTEAMLTMLSLMRLVEVSKDFRRELWCSSRLYLGVVAPVVDVDARNSFWKGTQLNRVPKHVDNA